MLWSVPFSRATIVAALALVIVAACTTARTDVMPTSVTSARELAQTVASRAGCSGFEDYNFNRAPATWVFTCQKPGLSFEIVAYGSEEARNVGMQFLDNGRNPYVAEKFFSVALLGSASKEASESALAAFKN